MNREILFKIIAYAIVIPYLCFFCLLLALRRGLARMYGLCIEWLGKKVPPFISWRPRKISRCPLCRTKKFTNIFDARGLGGDLYPIMKCSSCDLVFLGRVYRDSPESGDVRLWAETDLKGKGCETAEKDLFLEYNEIRKWPFGHYLATIRKHVPGGAILDLGCANGYFLSLFPPDRWERWGVEYNQDNHRECVKAGLENVFFGPLSRFKAPRGHFNVISMIEFIEHCADPLNALRRCRKLLCDGGMIFVVTGNLDSEESKKAGRDWAYLTAAPDHKFFFSSRTLRRLLEEARFRDIEFVLGDERNEVINVIAFKG